MKIYYWTPYMGNVGTIKATINSAIAMKKQGHEVKLYRTYKEWDGYEDVLMENGIGVIDFGLSRKISNLPSKNIGFRFSMFLIGKYAYSKLIENWEFEQPDVVVASLLAYLPVKARRKSKFKPIIINSIQGKPIFNAFRKRLWKKYYLDADCLCVSTIETKNDIVKNINYPENKIFLVNNPIIDDSVMELSKQPLPSKFEGESRPIILGVGRLTRQKDFGTLLEAYSIIRKKYDYKLWIIGEGEERQKLESSICAMNLQEDVQLIGFVKNPYQYMRKADIYVMSSLWEDPGHALIEAAYMKMKLVSTRCPQGPETFLKDGQAGNLCNVANPNDMARAIESAIIEYDPQKKVQAYQNALAYSIDMHAKRLTEIIEQLG